MRKVNQLHTDVKGNQIQDKEAKEEDDDNDEKRSIKLTVKLLWPKIMEHGDYDIIMQLRFAIALS